MAIGGAVSVAAVRHMHSTVERETDQLKNADAKGKIGVSADDGCGRGRAVWSIPGPKAVWFGPACIREIPVADICDPVSVQQ